jgi:hypothetical protein
MIKYLKLSPSEDPFDKAVGICVILLPRIGWIWAFIFTGLKLFHVISWSWWWALAPVFTPILILSTIIAVAGYVFICMPWLNDLEYEFRKKFNKPFRGKNE